MIISICGQQYQLCQSLGRTRPSGNHGRSDHDWKSGTNDVTSCYQVSFTVPFVATTSSWHSQSKFHLELSSLNLSRRLYTSYSFPICQNDKVIYVARNPKDAIVSFFYFHKLVKLCHYTGEMEEFVNYFIDNKCWYILTQGLFHLLSELMLSLSWHSVLDSIFLDCSRCLVSTSSSQHVISLLRRHEKGS